LRHVGLGQHICGEALAFERGERRLLDGIDIEIGGGTLVIGPNGAGKSLLARVLAGLVAPTAGQLTWAGRPPDRRRAPKIGFVFQRPVLLRRSALANVEYALAISGVARPMRRERALGALERARLAHLAHVPAHVLSGGAAVAGGRIVERGPAPLFFAQSKAA